jgi:hypothetical protein
MTVTLETCPCCGASTESDLLEVARRCYRPKKWGAAPVPYLGGAFSDLDRLVKAGLAERNAAGWWIPTPACISAIGKPA